MTPREEQIRNFLRVLEIARHHMDECRAHPSETGIEILEDLDKCVNEEIIFEKKQLTIKEQKMQNKKTQCRGENFDNLINQCSSLIINATFETDGILLERLVKLNETLAKETSEIVALLKNGVAKLQSSPAVAYEMVKIGDKVYKTVKIGKQTWLAENLNYKLRVEGYNPEELIKAWYYNDDEDTYGKYGLLYNWYGAMKAAEEIEGWHLPTLDEWNELVKSAGGFEKCADNLKDPKEWHNDDLKNEVGFSAFPAGNRNTNGSFDYVGSDAYFWTATEYSSGSAYYRAFGTSASMDSYYNSKAGACSVRLVQDS